MTSSPMSSASETTSTFVVEKKTCCASGRSSCVVCSELTKKTSAVRFDGATPEEEKIARRVYLEAMIRGFDHEDPTTLLLAARRRIEESPNASKISTRNVIFSIVEFGDDDAKLHVCAKLVLRALAANERFDELFEEKKAPGRRRRFFCF